VNANSGTNNYSQIQQDMPDYERFA